MTAIKTEGLTKRYGEQIVLAGVDLSLGRGERLALMGPSGAGKSTLARIVSGLLSPDEGSLALDGAPYAPRETRGYVKRIRGLMRKKR